MPRIQRLLILILLLLILGIAAALRFYNLNWDGGIFAHPDERSTVAFYAPTISWPQNSADILDPRASTLNPFWNTAAQERRSYTYGHFPLYTLVAVAHAAYQLLPTAEGLGLPPDWLEFLRLAESGQGYAQIGRALAALSDLFTVLLLFLMGRRLYGPWGGLLAAAFSAFTVLQIQLAHFFAVDPISTTFTLLAVYGAMRLYDSRSVGAALLTGVGIGLAVASKFSALPVVFAPVLAGFLTVVHANSKAEAARRGNLMIGLVLLALGTSFLVFAVTSPFVLLDFSNFARSVLEEQGNMVRGIADFPFTRQYRGTPAYWYFIDQQLRWGMGWALGLLGLAGTVWVVIKAIRGRAHVGELLGLAWLVLYFGPTGLFLAKFMRYMSPVVPFFSLFGAGLLVALWCWKGTGSKSQESGVTEQDLATTDEPATIRHSQFAIRSLAVVLAVIVLGSSAVWALAFANGVYGTEHPWITFSRWVYQNVPDGACIAYEHWDDRMPVPLPEPGANPAVHGYTQPILPMYDDDTQQKYEYLRDTLMNCDYVALATNRLWRTIPRLPQRYPMSTRFYDALFSGNLGFEIAHTVETPPQLGPYIRHDQSADESFTVYDHPKPILFKKTRQLSAAEWDALLGGTWQSAVPGYVGQPTLLMRLGGAQSFAPPPAPSADEQKSLLLDTPVSRLPVVDDFRWNSLANASTPVAMLVWWLAVLLVGWLTFPITFLLFHRLPDRGYTLGKSLGLLLLSYPVWMAGSVAGNRWLGNSAPTVIAVLVGLALVNAALLWQNRAALAQFRRKRRWLIFSTEAIFAGVYLLFVFLRLLNPDLWHPWLGGEKMLEIGFLNAVVKSAAMPPYDPFFAGGIMNYYYFGLFLVGVLIKLTGITPAIAFNLAVPTLAALTAVSVFGLAGNVAVSVGKQHGDAFSRLRYFTAGGLGILFVTLMGNLEGAAQFLRDLGRLSNSTLTSALPGVETAVRAAGGLAQAVSGAAPATYNYWDPTRVIPETINEFPFFSFLFADLHPHMIGIPFTLLLLSLAFNWLLGSNYQLSITNYQLPIDKPQSPLTPQTQQTELPITNYQLPIDNEQTVHLPTHHTHSTSQFTIHNSQFIIIPPVLRWLAFPFVLGALGVINTWDMPTYLGIIFATFLLAHYRQIPGELNLKNGALILGGSALLTGLALVVTLGLYLPFFAHYQAPAETGIGWVRTQTPLSLHLKIWGFFLFVIVSWLWLSLRHPASRLSLLRLLSGGLRRWNVLPHFTEIYRTVVGPLAGPLALGLWATGGLLLLSGLLFALGYRVPAYLLPLVALAAGLLLRREVSAATTYLNLLMFTGLLILLGVEFVYLNDFLGGGDYYRMNTLFKFFIQVWVLFGVAAAVALPQLWDVAWRWPLFQQFLWRGAVVILLLASMVYPVFGTRTRVDDRFPGDENRPPLGTLDGLAYMTRGVFEWPAGNPIELKYDDEAIRWLQENVSGTPVIAEAKIGYYREGGMRVAAYTGLPSILGGLHQNEQRYAAQVGERDFVVNEFWATPDPARTLQLMDQLGIEYVYIGQIERAVYGDAVAQKFAQLQQQGALDLIYQNEKTQIYRRNNGN